MPGERFIVSPSESTPEEEPGIFGESCQDINGRTIAGGHHYVPGPDSCTVCLCDEGRPKWCQAVLCAAPKDCKSFRIGSSCCEFICLDDAEGGGNGPEGDGTVGVTWGESGWIGGDMGFRLVATAVTAALSLALLAFLFYRLKRRRNRRSSTCHDDLNGEGLPSSSMASYEHGDITNSTGHLSRQPGPLVNMNDQQAPLYLMWKPTPDNPPPYTETAGSSTAAPPEEETQETTGLLSIPSAPLERDLEGESTMLVLGDGNNTVSVLVRRSNGTLDSEFLDAGTPPPSYAEVLASISSTAVDMGAEEQDVPSAGCSAERRSSASLPRQRSTAPSGNGLMNPAIQRFSLQLALDYSDDTSSSLSSSTASVGDGHSDARPLSFSSSSSAASLAQQ